MELMDHPLKVAPTAAIVLAFAQSLYQNGLTGSYYEKLDLQEGKALASKLDPAVGHAVIIRKRFIRYLLEQFLNEDEPVQICILGAGLDPLSLHLLEVYGSAVHSIYEVDTAHLPEKEHRYNALLPAQHPVHFIQADITDTLRLEERLRDAGYSSGRPTLVIFEGIIHYISEEHFINVMQLFGTANKTNIVLLDYMLPEYEIPSVALPLFNAVKEQVETLVGRPLQAYSRSRMFELIEDLRGDVASVDSMKEAEFKLNGRNEIYYLEGEGLIEMLSFYL
jgi:O-methyltransferase involved in polyketide biosynthesis